MLLIVNHCILSFQIVESEGGSIFCYLVLPRTQLNWISALARRLCVYCGESEKVIIVQI